MNRLPRLLRPFVIVPPFLAWGESRADGPHEHATRAVSPGFQAVAPSLAPDGLIYYVPVAPTAVHPFAAPALAPAAAPAGGFLGDYEGYAEMAAIADNTPLVNGRLFAAHIFQNLGKAAVKYGKPIGIELATFMFQNATRGVLPTPREREILERIVARFLNRRDEGTPAPTLPEPARPTVQHGDGKSVIIVIPPDSGTIRLQIGDGPTETITPEPEPRPEPTPEPEPEPEPTAEPGEAIPSLSPTAHAGRAL